MSTALQIADEKRRPPTMRIAFTTTRCAGFRVPPVGRVYVWDDRTPGLALCITANDVRTFYHVKKMNGRVVRTRIAGFNEINIDAARARAAELNGDAARGIDPMQARRDARAAQTFGEAFERFIENKKVKAKTWALDETRRDLYLKDWLTRQLRSITHEEVETLQRRVAKATSGTTANRVVALASTVFNRATRGEFNPARAIVKFKEAARARILTRDEIPRFLAAVEKEKPTIRDFLKVALFTGARRRNVEEMRWDQIDLDAGVWTIPHTKSGQPYAVPLVPDALKILKARKAAAKDSPWVFPSWGKSGHLAEPKSAWARVCKAAGIADMRLHDLRRSFGSYQAMAGVSLTSIQKSLGHLNSSTTARVYAVADQAAIRQGAAAGVAMMKLGRKRGTK